MASWPCLIIHAWGEKKPFFYFFAYGWVAREKWPFSNLSSHVADISLKFLHPLKKYFVLIILYCFKFIIFQVLILFFLSWHEGVRKQQSKGRDIAFLNWLLKKELLLYIEISAHTNNLLKSKNIIIATKLWPTWSAKTEGNNYRKSEEKQQIKVLMSEVRVDLT